MKPLILRFLELFGYKLVNTRSDHIFNFETFLYRQMLRRGELFFVQIGAYDGVTADPIHRFVKKYSRKVFGIAIEPQADAFASLRRNYAQYPNVRVANVAIHNTRSEMTLYRVDPSKAHRYHRFAGGIASFNKDHHLRSRLVPSESIIEERVTCITYQNLLDRFQVLRVDLLVMDTEGYDAEIILNMDLAKDKPSVIRFEHGLMHGTMSDKLFLSVTSFLNHNGYQLIVEQHDATAYLLEPADFKITPTLSAKIT